MASLQNHVNTHTVIRPHHCKFCGATFTISGDLVQRLIEGQSGLPGAIKARVDSEKKHDDRTLFEWIREIILGCCWLR